MVNVKKLTKRKQEGFTLVEVIVVLVILAILAAILIPTLTGYIDKANDRAAIAETRACVMAAQTILSENYSKVSTTEYTPANVLALADLTGKGVVTLTTGDTTTVTTLTYTPTGKKTCTYTNGTYTVAK